MSGSVSARCTHRPFPEAWANESHICQDGDETVSVHRGIEISRVKTADMPHPFHCPGCTCEDR